MITTMLWRQNLSADWCNAQAEFAEKKTRMFFVRFRGISRSFKPCLTNAYIISDNVLVWSWLLGNVGKQKAEESWEFMKNIYLMRFAGNRAHQTDYWRISSARVHSFVSTANSPERVRNKVRPRHWLVCNKPDFTINRFSLWSVWWGSFLTADEKWPGRY